MSSSSQNTTAAEPSNPSTPPATRVLRQFRVVFNAVKTHFRQVEREAGVGGAQLWALSVIDRRSVSLRIQPDGAEVLRSAPLPFAGVLPDALSALDAATLERLERDLGELIALLEADESSANVLLSQM